MAPPATLSRMLIGSALIRFDKQFVITFSREFLKYFFSY
jgi:hypothetical protein